MYSFAVKFIIECDCTYVGAYHAYTKTDKTYNIQERVSKKNDRLSQQINEVSQDICVKNPTMFCNRKKKLLSAAQEEVNKTYQLKKGKSHSKRHSVQSDPGGSKPKRKKLNRDFRVERMKTVEEIKYLKERVLYKEEMTRCSGSEKLRVLLKKPTLVQMPGEELVFSRSMGTLVSRPRQPIQTMLVNTSLEPGSPPPSSVREKKKEGESLEDLDHVLDIDDVSWTWFSISGQVHPRRCARYIERS